MTESGTGFPPVLRHFTQVYGSSVGVGCGSFAMAVITADDEHAYYCEISSLPPLVFAVEWEDTSHTYVE
jgi:hypothetical protein